MKSFHRIVDKVLIFLSSFPFLFPFSIEIIDCIEFCYGNGTFGVEFNRLYGDYVDRKNKNYFLADSLNVGSRESGGFERKRVNGCEISKLGEDGIKFPPRKKGKVSPVVCCGDGRASDGIGSKNGVVARIGSGSQSVSLNQRQVVEASLVETVLVDGFEQREGLR